jgi:hypothetical protein
MFVSDQLYSPASFTSETAPGTHCILSQVGPRASLEVMEEGKNYPTPNEIEGARVGVLLKALCYKPKGRMFETR